LVRFKFTTGRCAPIVADLGAALLRAGSRGLDGIIVTDTRAPQASFDSLVSAPELSGRSPACVVAPSLLRISPVSPQIVEEAAP